MRGGEEDCGGSNFASLEDMYSEIAGMASDMIDIGNLASRLADFIGKKSGATLATQISTQPASHVAFVDPSRLDELRIIKSPRLDLTKLIRLCEEINLAYANDCFMAAAMLTRAIIDHVPPIFGLSRFFEVGSNYNGSRSFKESMEHLQNSLRNLADHHLHVQIRSSETLPTKSQVNFSADVDVLLAEIVRLLKQP